MPGGPLKKNAKIPGCMVARCFATQVFVDIRLRNWHGYETLSIYKCVVTHDPLVPGSTLASPPPGCNERPPMCECLNPLAGEGRALSRSQRGVIGWRTCGTGE
jgi:hypothetical protein